MPYLCWRSERLVRLIAANAKEEYVNTGRVEAIKTDSRSRASRARVGLCRKKIITSMAKWPTSTKGFGLP